MTDTWVPAPPQPPSPPPPDGLPSANSWSPVMPCASADSPSIADGVIITGRPAVVSAMPWVITVNDGGSPANFTIDHYDASGVLIEHPIVIDGTTGDVLLTHDPTQPLGAVTKQYADNNPNYVDEAPINNQTYGRDNGAWVPLPLTYIPEAPNTSQRYGRMNSVWQLDAIQTDAPNDGSAYARQSGAWTAAVTGGPYLALTGGAISGSLSVAQVMTVQGSNSLVLNAIQSQQRSILAQTSGANRWQMIFADQALESGSNAGSNFALNPIGDNGSVLPSAFSIMRATGRVTFGTMISLPGGAAGQVLSTDGAGTLTWSTRIPEAPLDGNFYTRQNAAWAVAPGGMTDAPNDGTAYARNSAAWAHLSHTDITDWTATLAPYALTTSVPAPGGSLPIMDGAAAAGVNSAFSRQDHVHPSDTSRLAIAGGTLTGALTLAADPAAALQPATKQYVDSVRHGDNRIIDGNFAINQRLYVSATALAAGAYAHDRWKAGTGGSTYTFTTAVPDTTITITAGTLTQIIEAGAIEGGVYTLSWTGTAQARVYQGAPAGAYAASPLTTASLPTGVNTIVEFNTGTVTRVKFESGPFATPFNRQSMAKSLSDCQRYCVNDTTAFSAGFNAWAASSFQILYFVLPTTMRVTPTVALGSSSGNTNMASATVQQASPLRFGVNFLSVAPGGAALTIAGFIANAEL